jgi:N-acetylglutamate synthase
VGVDADEVARASARTWELMVGALPGAWTRREGGALGVVSGIELPWFNGVWGETTHVEPACVARLLDEVAATRAPHAMELRPGWPRRIAEIARDRGLTRVSGEPRMLLDNERHLDGALDVQGLSLRELSVDEGDLHARVAAAGGVVRAEAPYRSLTDAQVLSASGLRCYVGEVGGEAVTTAIAMTTEDCVGIFGVATLPGHRRRGYAAAVTARAVLDGFDAGARWAWLGASEAGYPVYLKLGFVAVEVMDLWESSRP